MPILQVTHRLKNHPCLITVAEMGAARHFLKTTLAGKSEEEKYRILQPTLEINLSHPIICKLNSLKSTDPTLAKLVAEQVRHSCGRPRVVILSGFYVTGVVLGLTKISLSSYFLSFCIQSSSLAFSLFGVVTSSFHSPRSPVLCFLFLYLFLLHVFSYNTTPPQFRSSYLSVSTDFHVTSITTSSSVFRSTRPDHLGLASLIFSLMFATFVLMLSSFFI